MKPALLRLAVSAAAAAAALLVLSAPAAADFCVKADQEANIRSQTSICSGSKGSVDTGDIIKVYGEPQQQCYTWEDIQVLTGGMKGTEGYTNLDAYSQTSCPGSPPAPPPNAPCKNAGQSCNSDSDCCQPGSGPSVPCQGSPKTCGAGAVVSSVASGGTQG